MFGIFRRKNRKTIREIYEEQQRKIQNEQPFVTLKFNDQKIGIKPSDMMELSNTVAYALETQKLSDDEAVEFAIIHFLAERAGNPGQLTRARITRKLMNDWCADKGLHLIQLSLHAAVHVKFYFENELPEKPRLL